MSFNKDLLKEKETTEMVDLCDSSGELRKDSVVWSRHPLINCNLSKRWPRKKKWNYWCVTNNHCLFSVTISNIDYVGMVFAYFLDFKTHRFIEKTVMAPFGKGCVMPDSVEDSVVFENPKLNIKFLQERNGTHIVVKCKNFNGVSMDANFKVNYPEGHETLNVVVPWDKKHFQFTSKHECLPVEGLLTVGDNSYIFDTKDTFACLDFGRGVWPYKVTWNWANASGIINGKTVGLNLGGKWTDGTGMTENALVVDGKITKLNEDVIFQYDPNDFMKPWILKTTLTDKVNLTFIPFFERIAKSNVLIVKSEVHQMVGHFSGTIKTASDETIVIENLLGCSEEHFGQW